MIIALILIILFLAYKVTINVVRAVHEIKELTYNINKSEKKEDGNI
jgi:hypothetical protein